MRNIHLIGTLLGAAAVAGLGIAAAAARTDPEPRLIRLADEQTSRTQVFTADLIDGELVIGDDCLIDADTLPDCILDNVDLLGDDAMILIVDEHGNVIHSGNQIPASLGGLIKLGAI